LLRFAVDGVLSHSIVPLRISIYAGLLAASASFLLGLFHFARMIVFGAQWPSGLFTVVSLALLGIGMNGIFFGIIGEYVGRIYLEVRRRPTTVVERAVNLGKP
jgi:dolichol-phosphate mannosyltransferase